jgi:hypothetical protein
MNSLNIKLYNLLKNNMHIPDDKAGEFVQTLDDLIRSNINDSAAEYKSFVKEDLLKLDSKIEILRSDLRSEIKESKIDTIKWMIGVFLALALMIIGLYIKK